MNWKATIGFTAAVLGCIAIAFALVAIAEMWGLWALFLGWLALVPGVGTLVGWLTRDVARREVRAAHKGEN